MSIDSHRSYAQRNYGTDDPKGSKARRGLLGRPERKAHIPKKRETCGFGDAQSKGYRGIRNLWEGRDRRRTKQNVWTRDEIVAIRASKSAHVALIADYQAGVPGSDEKLMAVNRGLLQNTVKRFRRGYFDEFVDLLQEAKVGLLEGCARYKLDSPYHPMSYLIHYVRDHVRRSITTSGCVVPRPTWMYNDKGGTRERARVTQQYVFTFTEMSKHWHDETDTLFEDTLTDDGPSAEEVLSYEEARAEMPALLAFLFEAIDERDRDVLRRRFGAEITTSLHGIGAEWGVTRERIRQIQEGALRKCRKRAVFIEADPRDYRTFEEWLTVATHNVLLQPEPD